MSCAAAGGAGMVFHSGASHTDGQRHKAQLQDNPERESEKNCE